MTRPAPSASARPASASNWTASLTWRTVAAAAGFLLALWGSFTAWVTVEGFSAGAFDDNAQFRLAKWLDTTSFPIDGLIVAALAIGGLVALWAWLSERKLPVPGSSLIPAAGLAIVAAGVVEMQYISSEGAAGVSWGFGLYLVVAGGALAAASPLIPPRPLSKGSPPAH